ncbi:hypothetical protein KVR01_008566 [Diaporthe batatas]|uniref:uncharacterized protein n=1 Tax=Diaporthe batatas TaxID=748121 RepID=UPI001D03B96A|nr:uncharacterized protein KVR01_008566 [Diaporthe batatas]KAG8161579.1 hypothetical protein KVR01_008566 [Diaporthe batatas]
MLVLDEELQSIRTHQRHFLEVVMDINLSGWMRRLWTLHESVRAPKIHFQFQDGTISREAMLNHARSVITSGPRSVTTPNYRKAFISATSNLFTTMRINEESNGAVRLAHMWVLLRWRHTSWPEDETICMANVLGLERDVVDSELLQAPPDARMKVFLQKFNLYPANLLFLDVPRLEQPVLLAFSFVSGRVSIAVFGLPPITRFS